MEWTDRSPTKTGYYFYADDWNDISLVKIFSFQNKLYMSYAETDRYQELIDGTWLGPFDHIDIEKV